MRRRLIFGKDWPKHLVDVGPESDYGWTRLVQDADTGAYYDRTYPYSGLQGGGPQALIPLDEEEVMSKYGCPIPPNADESTVIRGSWNKHARRPIGDHSVRIIEHLGASHFLELAAPDGNLYLDTQTGCVWRTGVAPVQWKTNKPPAPTLTRLPMNDTRNRISRLRGDGIVQVAAPCALATSRDAKAEQIIGHLLDCHLVDTGRSHDGDGTRLYLDPIKRELYELWGGSGEVALTSVSSETAGSTHNYAMPSDGKGYLLVSGPVEGVRLSIPESERILDHFEQSHLERLGIAGLYRDPRDSRLYGISRWSAPIVENGVETRSFRVGPFRLREVQYAEVPRLYRCLPRVQPDAG